MVSSLAALRRAVVLVSISGVLRLIRPKCNYPTRTENSSSSRSSREQKLLFVRLCLLIGKVSL